MNRKEKFAKCEDFMKKLESCLSDEYELVGSCNKDKSAYLIPKGTIGELTYMSKPLNSFRISDHWNWYANTKKCADEKYVQCLSLDMPWAKRRPEPGKPSEPRFGIQVGFFDGVYHHVFGEKFDRRTRRWSWVENDPAIIAQKLQAFL